jgi:hypothetical protein
MADSGDRTLNAPTEVVATYDLYRSDLERISGLLLNHWWCQEQVQDYGLNVDREILAAAILNVLAGHWEELLKSWTAEDWLRGDLGTAMQAEIKRLGEGRWVQAA